MSTILSFDCSGIYASVCLQKDGQTLHETMLQERLTHSQTLLCLLQTALQSTRLSLQELSALALTVGPGSFTGLRIGLALAKGLALPHNLPVVGVSTLEATARSISTNGPILAALNARRDQVYWAAFSRSPSFFRLHEDSAGTATQASDFLQMQKEIYFLVGDGAEMCYNKNIYAPSGLDATPFVARGVAEAAQQAFADGLAVPASVLALQYLRLSQAEQVRLASQAEKITQT